MASQDNQLLAEALHLVSVSGIDRLIYLSTRE